MLSLIVAWPGGALIPYLRKCFHLWTNFYSTYACASSNISRIADFSIRAAVSYHIGTVAQNIIINWSKCKPQTMRHRRLRKTQVVRVYFSTVPCDFKYVSNARLPITSHNLLREGPSLLSKKRDALKYFCFLAGKGLSAALPEFS